jgi:anti-sigma regulatory factor (Ser/Thr protein kinase)
VHVTVVDDGHDFDPLSAVEPDLVADPDSRPIGGLGVHMMRKLTDSLAYRRTSAGNELEFVKRLE